jgi:hypothetical protein
LLRPAKTASAYYVTAPSTRGEALTVEDAVKNLRGTMSLERFIFCPCKHPLDAHSERGCATCSCSAGQRDVIDRLLDRERDAIHRTWLGSVAPEPAPGSARAVG